jgi:hypothetical protein
VLLTKEGQQVIIRLEVFGVGDSLLSSILSFDGRVETDTKDPLATK